jgi:hypothetical protein
MPLHEFQIEGTSERIEQLYLAGEAIPRVLESSTGRRAVRVFPVIGSTPGRWGDSPGNERRYDRGLQCVVENDKHAAAIAASRGMVSVRELGTRAEVDARSAAALSKTRDRHAAENAEQDEYQRNLAKAGGDVVRAQTETWSAGRILADETIYSGGDPCKLI